MILDETRTIHAAWGEDGQTGCCVGTQGVTRIVPYQEAGQCGHVPWLQVWCGDRLYKLLNCAHLTEIYYQKEETT